MRAFIFATGFVLALATLLGWQWTPLSGRADDGPGPALSTRIASFDTTQAAATGDIIPGRYIVLLREGADATRYANALGWSHGFDADIVYRHALQGFAANLSEKAAEALRHDPNVLLVEPDRIVTASPQTLPTGVDRMDVEENATASINGDLGDLDIDVAVIDTGVDVDHPDLRVAGGARFVGFLGFCGDGSGSYDDDNGHGTHVAGIIGARDNDLGVVGVAPGARIWAVKVLNAAGSGSVSCLIKSVDWVTANADTIEVANLSVEAASSTALCNSIANSVEAGVVYAAAAGNSAADAQNTSPANCPDALTVSAIADFDGRGGGETDETVTFSTCTEDEDDSFACFSNFGSVVDMAAPGVNILSTYPGGEYAFGSGTSMASPHVAGAAALYLIENPAATPAQVRQGLLASAVLQTNPDCGFTGDPDSYPEPLVYVGLSCSGDTTPTPTATPSPIPTPTPTPTPTPGAPVLYFSLYSDQTLGGQTMANEDIVAFDGANFSLYFDGSLVGVNSLVLDAFAVISPTEILMSFSRAGSVPGIPVTVDDSDIVKFTADSPDSLGANTAGSFSLYFDGSDVGLTKSYEDVDAVELLSDGRLLISTTGGFIVDGLSGSGADEDIIAFTPTSLGSNTEGAWARYFDGSAVGLAGEDIDGLALDAMGNIYLSTLRNRLVTDWPYADEDVFVCDTPTTGDNTACTSFTLFFDGSLYGLTNNDLFAVDLP